MKLMQGLLELRTIQIFTQLDHIFNNPALLSELLGTDRAKRCKTGWGKSAKPSGGLYWSIYDPYKTHVAVVWRARQFWVKVFVAEADLRAVFSMMQCLSLIAKQGCITSYICEDLKSADLFYEIPISLFQLLNKKALVSLIRTLTLEVRVNFAEAMYILLHQQLHTIPMAYAEEEFDLDGEEDDEEETEIEE